MLCMNHFDYLIVAEPFLPEIEDEVVELLPLYRRSQLHAGPVQHTPEFDGA